MPFSQENAKHISDCVQKIFDLLPSLFRDHIRTLNIITFLLKNIALLLVLEVARWYSLDSVNQMCYWDSTLLFWRVGIKLFHGAFLRFMSGPKCEGEIINQENKEGVNLSPKYSTINFAVPNLSAIQAVAVKQNLPTEIKPGIIPWGIELKAKADTQVSYVLSVDGKKVSPGLTYESGDENLFGYETPNLQERQDPCLNQGMQI